MADTAALVVSLSAQLTKFEKDMREAGIMAERAVGDIEDKFSKINPKISTSFFGNLFAGLADKAISGVSDAIKEVISRFQELQKVSDYTDASMEWVYGLQEAFKKVGASVDDVNAAFKSVATSLDEIKRGGNNALNTLLQAPGNQQFLKGFNKDTATAEETMKRVLVIIGEQANMIRSVDVGKNIGVPASVAAAAWKEGGEALAQSAAAAAAAAPDLQKMANSAAMFDSYMRSAIEAIKAWISDNAWAGVKDTVAEIVRLLQLFQSPIFKGGPLENFGADALKNLDALQTKMNQEGPPTPTRVVIRTKVQGGTAEDPFARKGGADALSFMDRQNNALEKQIGLMNEQARAAGTGIENQEALKAQSLLYTAAERDKIEVTEELARSIERLAGKYGEAALKAAEAQHKIGEFNKASATVGSAISTAFADAVVEGKKLNEVLDALVKTLLKAAINASIMNLFTPGAGGGLAPALSVLGIGTRMAGGPVGAGQSYLVGERGPEMFRPNSAGMVVPNSALGRGAGGASTAIQNTFMVAGDVSPGTIARLQAAVVAANQKADGLTKVFASTQRLQASGVA